MKSRTSMPNMIITSMSERSPVTSFALWNSVKLQRGKFFAQPRRDTFGVNVDDENFGHERCELCGLGKPRYCAALPKAMSCRSGSASGT